MTAIAVENSRAASRSRPRDKTVGLSDGNANHRQSLKFHVRKIVDRTT
jgi:hypothetical protein